LVCNQIPFHPIEASDSCDANHFHEGALKSCLRRRVCRGSQIHHCFLLGVPLMQLRQLQITVEVSLPVALLMLYCLSCWGGQITPRILDSRPCCSSPVSKASSWRSPSHIYALVMPVCCERRQQHVCSINACMLRKTTTTSHARKSCVNYISLAPSLRLHAIS